MPVRSYQPALYPASYRPLSRVVCGEDEFLFFKFFKKVGKIHTAEADILFGNAYIQRFAIPPADKLRRRRHDLHEPHRARMADRAFRKSAFGLDDRVDEFFLQMKFARVRMHRRPVFFWKRQSQKQQDSTEQKEQADQKEKFAKEQIFYPDVPSEPVSPTELIRQQQEILAQNGENQRKRQRLHQLEQEYQSVTEELQKLLQRQAALESDLKIARSSAENLMDQSTAELEASIANIEEINRKVRANLDKEKAEEDAREYRRQYDQLSKDIEATRKEKTDLLSSASLPLPELTVEDGELVYKGQRWDNMSGSDRLKVATAIVQKLNPNCGFVLMDKLEQMDLNTLKEFGEWLEAEGLQAIATRVSTGGECSILISDGYSIDQKENPAASYQAKDAKTWKAGIF